MAVLCVVAGCATPPDSAQRDPRDPFEPFNRGVSTFNEKVDSAVFKPIAIGYRNVVPSLVRSGVSNFFSNLGEVWSTVNNTLQLKPQAAAESWMRFNVNTFLGLGGLLDVAGEMDIDRHEQDFGRTLAHYGVPTGPYLVLPLLGPSTVRDALAIPVENKGNLLLYIDDVPARNSLLGLGVIDARANLLRVGSVLDVAALDKYSFTRDVFLEIRRNGAAQETDSNGEVPAPAAPPATPVEPAQLAPPSQPAESAAPVAPAPVSSLMPPLSAPYLPEQAADMTPVENAVQPSVAQSMQSHADTPVGGRSAALATWADFPTATALTPP